MSDRTRLDTAYAAMEAAPDDDAARLRFFEQLAASELFLLLSAEADGDKISPEIFEMHDEKFVMAFDLESRMSDLTQGEAPFAAVSGRVLAQMLGPENLGIALNIDVAPSSTFLMADEITWLNETLAQAPQEVEKQIEKLFAPKGLPESFLRSLDERLAAATGLAHSAYLVGVAYRDGGQGHLLGIVDAIPDAQPALARAVGDVLIFSGLEAAAVDVAFFGANDPATPRLAKVGLRFDLPQPIEPIKTPPPGSDPKKPPILR